KTELGDDLYASFVRSSAVVEGPDHDLADVQEAASRNAIAVVLGLNERATASSGTVFNSQVTIDPRERLSIIIASSLRHPPRRTCGLPETVRACAQHRWLVGVWADLSVGSIGIRWPVRRCMPKTKTSTWRHGRI